MSTSEISTGHIQEYICRWQAGELAAIDELLRRVMQRLKHLAIRMMRPFSCLQPFHDVDDVLQNSLIRFVRSLRILRPPTSRDFFNLAAVHIRRELIDLARRMRRHLNSRWNPCDGQPLTECSYAESSEELEDWLRFHEAVERLPVEEREVVGLAFYHGWTQAQIAELFQVSVRTVRRRWHAACHRLQNQMGTNFII